MDRGWFAGEEAQVPTQPQMLAVIMRQEIQIKAVTNVGKNGKERDCGNQASPKPNRTNFTRFQFLRNIINDLMLSPLGLPEV